MASLFFKSQIMKIKHIPLLTLLSLLFACGGDNSGSSGTIVNDAREVGPDDTSNRVTLRFRKPAEEAAAAE